MAEHSRLAERWPCKPPLPPQLVQFLCAASRDLETLLIGTSGLRTLRNASGYIGDAKLPNRKRKQRRSQKRGSKRLSPPSKSSRIAESSGVTAKPRSAQPQPGNQAKGDAREGSIVSGAQLLDTILGKTSENIWERRARLSKAKSFGGLKTSNSKSETLLALHESEISGLKIDNELLRMSHQNNASVLRTENELLRKEQESNTKELRTENQRLRDSHKQSTKKLLRRIAELHPKARPVPQGALDEKRKFFRQEEVAGMLGVGKRQVRNYLDDKKLTRAAKKGFVLNDEKLRGLYFCMTHPKEEKG